MTFLTSRVTRVLAGLLLVLILFLAFLPEILKTAINRRLRGIDGYDGQVNVVRLNLLRGEVSVLGLRFWKEDAPEPPLLTVDAVDFNALWRPLFKGRLVASILIDRPAVRIVSPEHPAVKPPAPAPGAPPAETDWSNELRRAFPVKIEKLEVSGGSFHMDDPAVEGAPAFRLDGVSVDARNLTNSRAVSDTLFADIRAAARVMTEGKLDLSMRAAPALSPPDFKMEFTLKGLELRRFNGILRAYGKVDVQAGTLAMAGELAARKGAIEGYVRPALQNVEVFSWKEDVKREKKPLLRAAWEGMVELFKDALKHPPSPDQVATRVPIKGRIAQPETDLVAVTLSALRNAFITAILPRLEHSVR
jgi:hypothetical protein